MFTGLVEGVAEVQRIRPQRAHLEVVLGSDLSCQLSHNQSVAHQGICLSVTAVDQRTHRVTVIQETLKTTNASAWREGDLVNLERALSAQGRFEGHIVQGHIDTVATCTRVLAEQTNRVYTFVLGQESFSFSGKGFCCAQWGESHGFSCRGEDLFCCAHPSHLSQNEFPTGSYGRCGQCRV